MGTNLIVGADEGDDDHLVLPTLLPINAADLNLGVCRVEQAGEERDLRIVRRDERDAVRRNVVRRDLLRGARVNEVRDNVVREMGEGRRKGTGRNEERKEATHQAFDVLDAEVSLVLVALRLGTESASLSRAFVHVGSSSC